MVEKFVVFNKTTGEYFKRGYGCTTDQKYARLYSRRCDAQNSLNRHSWRGVNFDVYPVSLDLSVSTASEPKDFDTFAALNGVAPLPFAVPVKYFRDMYAIDIAGTRPGEFPLSVDIIDVLHENIKYLGTSNGTRFVLYEKNFETCRPLQQMIGAELLRQFGYTYAGRRLAFFEVDWFNDDGSHKVYDY